MSEEAAKEYAKADENMRAKRARRAGPLSTLSIAVIALRMVVSEDDLVGHATLERAEELVKEWYEQGADPSK